jgi:hypothetical protein
VQCKAAKVKAFAAFTFRLVERILKDAPRILPRANLLLSMIW